MIKESYLLSGYGIGEAQKMQHCAGQLASEPYVWHVRRAATVRTPRNEALPLKHQGKSGRKFRRLRKTMISNWTAECKKLHFPK